MRPRFGKRWRPRWPQKPISRNPREQLIVHACLDYLRYNHIPHAHVRNSGRIAHGPNGIYFARDPRAQPGIADILANIKGKAVAFEIKSKTGRLRDEQVEWLAAWTAEGGVALVIRSLDDLIQEVARLQKP